MKTYNGAGWEYGESVVQTTDSGYILFGGALNPQTDTSSMYLVKTDLNGDTVWMKLYGEKYFTWGYSVQQTTDNGFILVGVSTNNKIDTSVDSGFIYLVKTNETGDTLWTKYYDNASGLSVEQTTDGGYIIVGAQDDKMYLSKTNANGDSLWSKTYSAPLFAEGYCVQQTSDSGYILVGRARLNVNDYSMYLVKTDSIGNVQWNKYFGTGSSYGHAVQQTTDGGYIACGSQLVRVDPNGDTLWTRSIGGFHSVQQTTDGGYILAGENGINTYLVKTDSDGYTDWAKTFGFYDSHSGKSVKQTTDGGYILTGHTSILTSDKSAILIKTDSLGNAPPFVSVSELLSHQSIFTVYPNPTTGQITLTNLPENENIKIAIYNVLGELLYVQKLSEASEPVIDLSALSDGIYLIQLEVGQMTLNRRTIKH